MAQRRFSSWLAKLNNQKRSTPLEKHRLALEELENRNLLSGFNYDFGPGNSPLAPGYTPVSVVGYNAAQGYGWESTSGLSAVSRDYPDPLKSDFITGATGTFLVDVPNGTYNVAVTLGDAAGA